MKLLLLLSALLAGLTGAGSGDRLPLDARTQSFIGVAVQACGEESPAAAHIALPVARPQPCDTAVRQPLPAADRLAPQLPPADERRLE